MTILEVSPNEAAGRSETLTADYVYRDVVARLTTLEQNSDYFYGSLGVRATEAVEYPINGPHRYLVIDETLQDGKAFKTNGMAYAVAKAADDNPKLETVITSSAGNAAEAVAIAASRHNLEVIANVPKGVSPVKLARLEQRGVVVRPYFQSVEAGLADAASQAERSDGRMHFLHPYDDPDAIAGQAMVGRRILDSLLKQQAGGSLDLHRDPVVINVQVGGGSLLTGVACVMRRAKDLGLLGDNVRLQAVRPERKTDGELNEKFDGLCVERLGSYAQTMWCDKRFVQHYDTVTELDAGQAAHRLAGFLGKCVEPAGLVGAAAYEKQTFDTPTVFVTIASGANVTPEAYDYFRGITRRHQLKILGDLAANRATRRLCDDSGGRVKKIPSRASLVWAGPTAAQRTGLVSPVSRSLHQPRRLG